MLQQIEGKDLFSKWELKVPSVSKSKENVEHTKRDTSSSQQRAQTDCVKPHTANLWSFNRRSVRPGPKQPNASIIGKPNTGHYAIRSRYSSVRPHRGAE